MIMRWEIWQGGDGEDGGWDDSDEGARSRKQCGDEVVTMKSKVQSGEGDKAVWLEEVVE